MENTKINLYTESVSAKINRLEHTIRELTQLIQQKQNKINQQEAINKSICEHIKEIENEQKNNIR